MSVSFKNSHSNILNIFISLPALFIICHFSILAILVHVKWFVFFICIPIMCFPGGSDGKESPAVQEIHVRSLGWEDTLEEGMATHSSVLAWRVPMDKGAWRATVHGVAKGRT